MRIMDCVCGARQTGGDEEELFAAIRRHSDEKHAEMNIPDAAIRSMIDAQSRMTPWAGETTTLERPPEIVPLTPDRLGDFLRFFDRDAFMDNPIWAGCYCLYPHFAGTQAEWQPRSGDENRADRAAQIERGDAHGLLAYADGKVVAWCNASPRGSVPMFDNRPELDADDADAVGSIVCFAVAAPYRGQGIARMLLDAACDELRSQGLSVAEAYPLKTAESAARAHLGTVSLYRSAGFTEHRDAGRAVVMRKSLV